MKKLLALVLALVMTLGLATVGANAAFTDQAAVNASDFSTAITVLGDIGVFKGDENNNFKPNDTIDRASTAAMIYRIYTGDTGTDKYGIYANDKFSDVPSDKWYAGYIGFCENAEFIKGAGDGKFYPDDKVTGYQALAMVLRAMGMNKQNDFTGTDWEITTARIAADLGLVKNVSSEVLKQPASRALVAEIIWEAIQQPTFSWTPAGGYSQKAGLLGTGDDNQTLAWKNFQLDHDTKSADMVDQWGNPYTVWFKSSLSTATYNTGDGDSINHSAKTYSKVEVEPAYETTKPITECDLAEALGLTKSTPLAKIFVNGVDRVNGAAAGKSATKTAAAVANVLNGNNSIDPLATTSYVGGQGTLLKVYKTSVNGDYSATIVNTYLAQVTDVKVRTNDPAGHLKTPAMLTLNLWYNNAAGTAVYRYSTTDYTYAKGDFVLMNLLDDATAEPASLKKTASSYTTAGIAFANASVSNDPLQLAESFTGTQTLKQYLASKGVTQRTISGAVEDQAEKYLKDEAVQDGSKAYTWFRDQYGNVIGSAKIETVYNYGVINDLWWNGNFDTGVGTARANVTYMNGSEATITISKIAFDESPITGKPDGTNTPYTIGYADATENTMKVDAADRLRVAPESSNNLEKDTYGIIAGKAATTDTADSTYNDNTKGVNLFRFETLANGTVVAEEVATEIINGNVVRTIPYIDGDKSNDKSTGYILVNSDTQYLVRTGNGSAANPYAFKAYTGYSNANAVSFKAGQARIDYVVDPANKSYAKYVFVYGGANATDTFGFVYVNSEVTFVGDTTNNNSVKVYTYSYKD